MSHTRLPKAVLEELRAIPILRGSTDRELAIIARHTTGTTVDAGTVLCKEGTAGWEAFIIVSGEAEVRVGDVLVARLSAGDVCGEVALLDHGLRTATVIAVAPTKVLTMTRGDFASLVHAAPTFTRRLLEAVSARLRDADQAIQAG
jgi:CRP/FNR family transcriptional regulator, cyclic AMP receptor protein